MEPTFKKGILIRGHRYEVLGITRPWNPLPGIDLEKYPLPEGDVTELCCPEADGICTWGETEKKATDRMIKAIMHWVDRKSQADGGP
jgi:hypothetical protein